MKVGRVRLTLSETESSSDSTRCHVPAGTYSTEPGVNVTSVASANHSVDGAVSKGADACCVCTWRGGRLELRAKERLG